MQGDKRIDKLMLPVLNAINRHVKDRDAKTDIYNRAYEAVMISMVVKTSTTGVKTPSSIENTNPDYYKQEIARRDEELALTEKKLCNIDRSARAEVARLSELLHDEMSQLEIATDLGNKRWIALNEIYENAEKHNANWCKRKAQEGLGIK